MTELIWLNGEVMPLAEARVGVEDRGFQFADGVYEVMRVYDGQCFALGAHLERLERSAGGIKLRLPISIESLSDAIDNLVERSDLGDGIVYLQLTRGCCARNHVFPGTLQPTLLFHTREMARFPGPGSGSSLALHSVADVRWQMCWIKSIALLANVLARNEAAGAGADEAVFVENGIVSECSTSNLFVALNGKLVTHPVGPRVLPGITRAILLDIARELDIDVEERPLREDEAMSADEVFITSTAREVGWVSRWNQRKVGGATCGPIARRLHEAFAERIIATRGARRPRADRRA